MNTEEQMLAAGFQKPEAEQTEEQKRKFEEIKQRMTELVKQVETIKLEKKVVQVGSNQTVVIDKLFGPLIFANLRITADAESGDWLIEREWIEKGQYILWARIPGQIEQEFSDK